MAGVTEFSEEEIYYLRACYVTTRIIPDALRTVFKREWDNCYKANHGQWLDTTKNGVDFYNMESPRSRRRNPKQFTKIKNGNTLEWDCTCLFVSILFSDSIGARLDPTVKNSIDDLREFRNNTFHATDGSLSEAKFQTCIKTVVSAFTTLKLDVDVLEKIKKQEKFPKELKRQLEEEKKEEEPEPFCILPPKPSHEVINRTDEVMKILEEMERLRSDKKNEITIIYLSGNPGCGKSEMARQIGDKMSKADSDNKTDIKFVFTLNASSIDTLIESYIELVYALRYDENFTTIWTLKDLSKDEKLIHLKVLIVTKLQKYSSWLLIVDNVTDIKSISRYIPKAGEKTEGKGQLLVTTQDSLSIANDPYTYHRSLKDGMQCDEAIQALCKISNFAANEEITIQVAKVLDFQPLALACAATYMRCIRSTELSISWEKYMEKLEEGKRESTETEYAMISLAYSQPMSAAVRMAVEREMNKKSVVMHALQFLSVMAPEPIHLEYVAKYVKSCMPDEDQFLVAYNISSSSLIITEDESKEIRVHQIVHRVVHSFLEKEIIHNNKEHTFRFLVKVIETFSTLQQSYKSSNFNFILATKSLVVHFTNLAAVLSSCILNTVSIPDEHLRIFLKSDLCLLLMGRICKRNGMHDSSLIFFKLSLTIKERHFGPNHQDLGPILNDVGNVLSDLGKYEEAKKCLERALVIEEMTYDQNNPNLAPTLSNLGSILRDLGKYEEAKKCLKRALAIQEMTYDQNNPNLAPILSNLGNVLSNLGKYEEAKKCLERALAIQEMTYDQNNPTLAPTLSNLGNILSNLGKYEEAKKCLERALAIEEMTYDQNNPTLAPTLNNLGNVLSKLGKYEEAKKCLERALAINEMTYDQNNPTLAPALSNLGNVLSDLGKYEEAKKCLERALSILEMTYDQNNPTLAPTLSNLGNVLRDLGKYEEAKKCLERALAIQEMTYDQNNPTLAPTLHNLGNVLSDLGKYEEAKRCLERALAIEEMTYDQNHPNLATTLINVGNVLRELGKYKEAEKCLKRALAIYEMTYDQNHPYFAFTYNYLGKVFGEAGKNEEAINYLKKALAIRESVYNQNHPHLATTLSDLGKVLSDIGKQEEGKKYLEKALAIQEIAYDQKHPNLAITLSSLGYVLHALGYNEEAEKCLEKALAIQEMAYDQSHPILTRTLNNQGKVLNDTGKQKEAKKCFERALAIQEMAYDQNHPTLANTLRNLGNVLTHFEKEKEAKKCFERAMAIERR